LPEDVAHHAIRVTRLGVGDALTLFDGTGGEYAASVTHIDRRTARVHVNAFIPDERESPFALTLVQAIIAADAMDYAVRKAGELGVHAIVPVITARSAPLPAGDRAERRQRQARRTIHHFPRGIKRASVTRAPNEMLLGVPAQRASFVSADGPEGSHRPVHVDDDRRLVAA